MSLKEYLGPIWDAWSQLELETWKRTIARSAWVPCNWKVVLDNFNESYHVPTVHMAATPDTDRKKITSNINTYYKETRFDLSNEGHNRMVMQGGYGSGQTDKEGNIREPLASTLRDWGIDPEDFKGRPEATRAALQDAKRQARPIARLQTLLQRSERTVDRRVPLHAVPELRGVGVGRRFPLPARTSASQRSGAVPVRQLVVFEPRGDRASGVGAGNDSSKKVRKRR